MDSLIKLIGIVSQLLYACFDFVTNLELPLELDINPHLTPFVHCNLHIISFAYFHVNYNFSNITFSEDEDLVTTPDKTPENNYFILKPIRNPIITSQIDMVQHKVSANDSTLAIDAMMVVDCIDAEFALDLDLTSRELKQYSQSVCFQILSRPEKQVFHFYPQLIFSRNVQCTAQVFLIAHKRHRVFRHYWLPKEIRLLTMPQNTKLCTWRNYSSNSYYPIDQWNSCRTQHASVSRDEVAWIKRDLYQVLIADQEFIWKTWAAAVDRTMPGLLLDFNPRKLVFTVGTANFKAQVSTKYLVCNVKCSQNCKVSNEWVLTTLRRKLVAFSKINPLDYLDLQLAVTKAIGNEWTGLDGDWLVQDERVDLEDFSEWMCTTSLNKSTHFGTAKFWQIGTLRYPKADIMILQSILPNATFNCDYRSVPPYYGHTHRTIYLHVHPSLQMISSPEAFQFITCGGVETGWKSLLGYISSYDIPSWITVVALAGLTTVATMALHWLLHVVLNGSDERRMQWSIYLSMPYRVLLEQGHNIPDKVAEKGYMRHFISVWLLMGVVLSNAYKGQNITDLSSPVPPELVKRFEELHSKNFSLYFRTSVDYGLGSEWIDLVRRLADSTRRLYTWELTVLSMFTKDESNETLHEFYQNILNRMANISDEKFVQLVKAGIAGYTEAISRCDLTAFVSTTSEIEVAENALKLKVYNRTKDADKMNQVSISEEKWFTHERGWHMENLNIDQEFWTQRASAIIQSGIALQWRRWESIGLIWKDFSEVRKLKRQVKKLSMDDNVVVVFYSLGVFVLLCLVALVFEVVSSVNLAEIYLKILSMLNSGKYFVRKFALHVLHYMVRAKRSIIKFFHSLYN